MRSLLAPIGSILAPDANTNNENKESHIFVDLGRQAMLTELQIIFPFFDRDEAKPVSPKSTQRSLQVVIDI